MLHVHLLGFHTNGYSRQLWPAPAVFLEILITMYMTNIYTMHSNIFATSFRIIYIVFNFCSKITTPLRQKADLCRIFFLKNHS